MSKIIENFLIPLFVVVSILYAFNSFSRDTIELNKAYHHITREPGYLERANISFYFSRDPHIQEVKEKKSDDAAVFFFPGASIVGGECEAMIQSINAQHDGYKISVKQVTIPTHGIELAFNLDSEQCTLGCECFDSIGLQKGLVFRVYNKSILKSIENNNNKAVLRTLHHQNNKPRIVIDPGHGGYDSGAVGRNGLQEKEVCLAIGTAVGNLLEQHGCSVLLTRNNDCTIPLDERTAYANNNHADLFVSIHANYAASQRAIGVETFCMQPQLLTPSFSDLSHNQDACVAQMRNERFEHSLSLAQSVQKHACAAIAPFHTEAIDRKVKHSVSQVLLGTQVPAILIEVGFLSHPQESQLLNDAQYRQSIARGICNGIVTSLKF